MNKRNVKQTNKFLKVLTVILLIIFLLLFLWDLRQFQFAAMKNINQNNQKIHNLQLELETVKSLNSNLVKLLATQKVRVDGLETSIVSELNNVTQPTVQVNAPEKQIEQSTSAKEGYTYLDFLPYETIVVVVGALELVRQMIMPKWSFN